MVVVIAHELAHQWFGNLVTMEWWNSLFLNEGDARLWEYFVRSCARVHGPLPTYQRHTPHHVTPLSHRQGTQAAHPEFEVIRQFVSTEMYPAMAATWYGNSRQLVSSVTSTASIEAQFDSVSYSFGASILYQLMEYLNGVAPGSYLAGMKSYLLNNAYGNAEPAVFWDALAAAANMSALPAYMNSYTSQTGYAVVSVTWENADGPVTGVGTLAVSQARHFLSPYAAAQAPAVTVPPTWWVPLTLYSEHPGAGSGVPAAVAAAASTPFTGAVWPVTIGSAAAGTSYSIARDGYLKLNANSTGYYRVAYPANMWAAFASGIATQLAASVSGPASAADRGNLLNDLFTFAYGRIYAEQGINMTTYLSFATWLAADAAYEAWMPALSAFGRLRQLLYVDSVGDAVPGCTAALDAYANNALSHVFATLNFTGDNAPLMVALRSSVISAGSAHNNTAIVAGCNALYAGGVASIPVNLQLAVLSSVVRWAPTEDVFHNLWDLYLVSNDANVKRRYITAMAATRDPELLAQLLDYAGDPNVVRTQDVVNIIVTVAANPLGRALAWSFVKSHWDWLMIRFGQGGFALSDLVFGSATYFNTPAMLAAVQGWYADSAHAVEGATLDYLQAQEMIGTSAAWVTTDLPATCAWLASYAATLP